LSIGKRGGNAKVVAAGAGGGPRAANHDDSRIAQGEQAAAEKSAGDERSGVAASGRDRVFDAVAAAPAGGREMPDICDLGANVPDLS
jgi:hypothetical protein